MRIRRWRFWRRGGVVQPSKGTFVQDVTWHRSEELRPDRLGPDEDDINDDRKAIRDKDPWRPRRTLD